MKRLLTCASLVLVIAVSVASTIDRVSPRLLADENVVSSAQFALGESDRVSDRQKLVELYKSKVEAMSDEDVQKALQEAEATLRLRRAEARLHEAVVILEEVSKEYADLPISQTANEMLKHYPMRGSATGQVELPDSFVSHLLPLMTERQALIEKVGLVHPDVLALDSKIADTRALLEEHEHEKVPSTPLYKSK